jgi:hypothetical protein
VAAEDVLQVCDRLGVEGVIAKRLDSVYVPGSRSRHWLKFKTARWKEHHGLDALDDELGRSLLSVLSDRYLSYPIGSYTM